MTTELRNKRAALAVLDDIPVVLDEYGWTQGTYGDKEQGFCAMGACSESTKRVRGAGPAAHREAWNAIYEQCVEETNGQPPVLFNDRSTTRKRNVVALIRRARRRLARQVKQLEKARS